MRPIHHAISVAMLGRVVVDVVKATPEVGGVTDQAFPVTSLPDAAFFLSKATGGRSFASV
jgi:hypothetical protein